MWNLLQFDDREYDDKLFGMRQLIGNQVVSNPSLVILIGIIDDKPSDGIGYPMFRETQLAAVFGRNFESSYNQYTVTGVYGGYNRVINRLFKLRATRLYIYIFIQYNIYIYIYIYL